VLERSGVGSAQLLTKLEVPVVSDLPGVGEEYQDHYTTLQCESIIGGLVVLSARLVLTPARLVFRVSEESSTTDDFLRGERAEVRQKMFGDYSIHPERAQLASNCIDAGFKLRPTDDELKSMGPEFNQLWNTYFKDKPDKVGTDYRGCSKLRTSWMLTILPRVQPVMFSSIVSGA